MHHIQIKTKGRKFKNNEALVGEGEKLSTGILHALRSPVQLLLFLFVHFGGLVRIEDPRANYVYPE